MLEQDLAYGVLLEVRTLLDAQKKFASRIDGSVDGLLRRAEHVAVQNLARADELTNGLRELASERQRYVAEVDCLRQRLHAAEDRLRESADREADLTNQLEAAGVERAENLAARTRAAQENAILRAEQQRLRRELTSLRSDLSLKEAYLVETRRQSASSSTATLRAMDDEKARLLEEHAKVLDELKRSRVEVAALLNTLALPRYVFADALNRCLRPLGPVHSVLKALAGRRRVGSAAAASSRSPVSG